MKFMTIYLSVCPFLCLLRLLKYDWLDVHENNKVNLDPILIPLNFESDPDHSLDAKKQTNQRSELSNLLTVEWIFKKSYMPCRRFVVSECSVFKLKPPLFYTL